MKQFTKDVRAKGWTLVEFAKEIGLTPRQLDRIANNPKRIHILALAGLADRTEPKSAGFKYTYRAGSSVEEKVFDNELGRPVSGLHSVRFYAGNHHILNRLEFTTFSGDNVTTTSFNIVE